MELEKDFLPYIESRIAAINEELQRGVPTHHVSLNQSKTILVNVVKEIDHYCGYASLSTMRDCSIALIGATALFLRVVVEALDHETQPPHAELPIPQRDETAPKIDG